MEIPNEFAYAIGGITSLLLVLKWAYKTKQKTNAAIHRRIDYVYDEINKQIEKAKEELSDEISFSKAEILNHLHDTMEEIPPHYPTPKRRMRALPQKKQIHLEESS